MACCSSTKDPPAAPATGANPPGCAVAPCPLKVTVAITLSQPVACPGHPLSIKAVGTPSGGTYAWTVAGAELVDGAGSPVSAGDTVNLRFFKANDADGSIPEHTATVSVTYTHPNGTATDSKPVKVHKITFDVTDTDITSALTRANETDDNVNLEGTRGLNTMVTDPKVKIKIDPSCPRKAECAKNHRVGWLQTLISVDRRTRYTHTLNQLTKDPLPPLRDGDPKAGPSPFPFYDAAPFFTGDGNTQKAHHFDSPVQWPLGPQPWIDPRPDAPDPPPPKNRQLRLLFFQIAFHAWLVVQNDEWSKHDLPGSFAYQKHFDWSIHYDATVDTSKATGSRCAPQSSPPKIDPMTNGKGPSSPSLMDKCSNELNKLKSDPAPGI
jgi:hypothetical protein